jgi:hypothetical protein
MGVRQPQAIVLIWSYSSSIPFLNCFPEIEKQRLVVICFEKTWAHDEGELLVSCFQAGKSPITRKGGPNSRGSKVQRSCPLAHTLKRPTRHSPQPTHSSDAEIILQNLDSRKEAGCSNWIFVAGEVSSDHTIYIFSLSWVLGHEAR